MKQSHAKAGKKPQFANLILFTVSKFWQTRFLINS